MGHDEPKEAHVQESYNQHPILQVLTDLQRGFNPDPIAQTVSQLLQGEGGAPPSCQPPSTPTPPPSATPDVNGSQQE
jgi:hypothetical protein